MSSFSRRAFGQADDHLVLSDRNKFPVWTFHCHRICEIDEMHNHGIGIPPGGYLYKTRSGNFNFRLFICGPLDRIAKQFEVVDVEHFPKSTVDIPGEVNNTTSRREIAEIDFCDIGPGLT